MSEAKSDLRKACKALYVDVDGVPRCLVCQMPMNGEAESHLPDCRLRVLQESLEQEFATGPLACDSTHTMFWNVLTENEKMLLVQFVQSYANALVAAAVEACAKKCEELYKTKQYVPMGRELACAKAIRSTVTPESAAKELGRIKAEARLEARIEEHKYGCQYCENGASDYCERGQALGIPCNPINRGTIA